MKKIAWIASIIFITFTNSYADELTEPNSINSGVQGYDWQSCFNAKAGSCINDACRTSENPNCKDNCNAMAKDKCISEGLTPP